ncbi:putative response regulatory protein [Paenibacillus sp. P1XP2]|nr:putative response regulatory protein [Paenibacillus sp. P1XP2]
MYKVLLVDDEAIARMGIRSTFDWEVNGFELVGEASNGQRAMKWVESKEIDILITDIAMPVMDGLELARRTREICPWVKVLLLSCHSDFEYVREGIRLGAFDYILKPMLSAESLKTVLYEMRHSLQKEKEDHRILEQYKEKNSADTAVAVMPLPLPADCPPPDKSLHQRIVQQAVEYISEHFTESISLQQVADKVCVSRNYFSEMFKRVTGHNFIDYLITLRVNRAKELLQNPTLKVYEVAEMSGFNDTKHFSKQFKKVVGLTPAEFQGMPRRSAPFS